MKIKVTKKEIMNRYDNVIILGYCDMQLTLNHFYPQYYTCGIYGWNADIYVFGDCAICTGYRSFGNIAPDYRLIKEVEKKSSEITNSNMKEEQKTKKINALINRLIKKVTTK